MNEVSAVIVDCTCLCDGLKMFLERREMICYEMGKRSQKSESGRAWIITAGFG